MPLTTNVSSQGSGPSYDLDVSVVEVPGPGHGPEFRVQLSVVLAAGDWSIDRIRPKPDLMKQPKQGWITLLWLDRKVSPKAKHFRIRMKSRRKQPKSGVCALAWDPILGAMAPASWTAP